MPGGQKADEEGPKKNQANTKTERAEEAMSRHENTKFNRLAKQAEDWLQKEHMNKLASPALIDSDRKSVISSKMGASS